MRYPIAIETETGRVKYSWKNSYESLANKIFQGIEAQLIDRISLCVPNKQQSARLIEKHIIPKSRAINQLPIHIKFVKHRHPKQIFIDQVYTAINQHKNHGLGITALANTKRLHRTFDALNAVEMPIMLILDNADLLADDKHQCFTAALRSFVINRTDNHIKLAFVGTDKKQLRSLFNSPRRPFYGSGGEFVELGDHH